MTPSQQKAVEWLRQEILAHDGLGAAHQGNYEYKRFEITTHDWGQVSVISEVGGKNDEGTMAQVFARTRRHIFIGPRGGLRLVNTGRYVKKTGEMTFAADAHGRSVVYALTM